MFHRIKKPHKLSSSRYFTLARHLPSYAGAVQAALVRREQEQQPQAQPVAPGSGGGQPTVLDVSTVAAMTTESDFPGIEFVGG